MKQFLYIAHCTSNLIHYTEVFLNVVDAKCYCIENIITGWAKYLFDTSTNLDAFPKTSEFVNLHRNDNSDSNIGLLQVLWADTRYDFSDLCSLINKSPYCKDLCYVAIDEVEVYSNSVITKAVINRERDICNV